MKEPLTFVALAATNRQRAERWHKGPLSTWSVTDWSNATAGEMGEICNAVKKLRRIECDMQQHAGDSAAPADREQAVKKIGKEIGDTLTYLDLLAQSLGLSLEDCVRETFNAISEREGFPEKL